MTSCPRYFIVHRAFGGGEEHFEARIGGPDGELAGYLSAYHDRGTYQVMQSKVFAGHRRCGVGTKLYEKAAKVGCEIGVPLESDEARSGFSHAFWEKQVRKGRAVCAKQDTAKGRGEPKSFDDIFIARGGCAFFKMKCPVTSLEGRPSKPRSRSKRR